MNFFGIRTKVANRGAYAPAWSQQYGASEGEERAIKKG